MPFHRDDLPTVALEGLNKLHGEEVEMINELALLAAACDDPGADCEVLVESISDCLLTFDEHVAGHFLVEETNMERTAYPELAEHKAAHDDMRERFDALLVAWRATPDPVPVFAFFDDYLPAWFIEHVGTFDVPTAEHVAAAG